MNFGRAKDSGTARSHGAARLGTMAAVVMTVVLGLTAPALAAVTSADPAEQTTEVTNRKSIGAQIRSHLAVKCPWNAPYVKSVTASAYAGSAEDGRFASFDEFWQSTDGQLIKVYFSNSQSLTEAAHHPVVITFTLAATCTNVKPTAPPRLAVRQNALVKPGGVAVAQVLCPYNYPVALGVSETHADWMRSHGTFMSGGLGGATWENPDELVSGSGSVTVYCGAP